MSSTWEAFHSAFSRCAISLLGLGFALLLLAPSAQAQTYTTNFPLTENPISEGGKWLNGHTNGIDWGDISTTPGQTHDHSGPARYADATAILTGSWGADQTVQETVYAGAVSGAPEVEIRLRSALSAHNCSGYEITHSVANGQNGNYLIIVRWNGPLGNFTYLASLNGAQYSVTTGDVVKATMIGSVITVYKNGVQETQVSDSTFANGNPGMGFNEQTNGTYGITSFTASDTIAANNPPTVATAAAANPSTVTGTTTALSVLGGDDGGEPALTYTWATTGTPPATVAFSANGTNAAKAATATFTKAGSYALQATIRDAGGQTVTSSVTVTVNQTLSAIVVAPSSASVVPGGTQAFVATLNDQFGQPLSAQPIPTWTVTGGGTISSAGLFTAGATIGGPFTVTAASGGKSGSASVSVAAAGAVSYHIDCGGPAASPFIADQYFTGGGTYSSGTAVSTIGVANAAPAAVYQSERYGTSSYALPGLTAGGAYTVRLHFAEIYWNAANQRVINVDINGTRVLAGFDIWTAAGGMNKALVRDFTATASAGGQIAIAIAATSTSADQNGKISGIEILAAGATNAAPTVATAAAANPSPVTAASTTLTVLGADDGGEAALTYTWMTTGTPPATVAFSANGTNAAKSATATFSKAGSYAFQVVIRDAGGLTATSNVSVTVNQTLTAITVAPATASVTAGGTQTFTATAKDQFSQALTTQPTFTWTASGGGTISTTGVFTAGSTAGGPFTVTAASGGKSGTASVTVTSTSLFAVKINFQPAQSPTVAGYLVDGGLPFADRGNGYSYGWNVDLTADSRDRNLISDQLRDTLIHLQKPGHAAGVWELAVPNGTYRVYLVSGDPGYTDSVYGINVEGVLAVSGTPTSAAPFLDSGAGGVQVTVSDGKLTVSNAASGANNKVCYIEVTQVPTGTN